MVCPINTFEQLPDGTKKMERRRNISIDVRLGSSLGSHSVNNVEGDTLIEKTHQVDLTLVG